jgi:hypothetical protein
MLDSVAEPPTPSDPDRGWEAQLPATFGWAPILPGTDLNGLLVEAPYGAHSAVLLALDDEDDRRFRLCGAVTNGTGGRFHVREASDGSGHEVVTLDHISPLRMDRSMATMPSQLVYYRLTDDGFVEVGRGEVYDHVEAGCDIPRAVEPFLDPEWIRQQRP